MLEKAIALSGRTKYNFAMTAGMSNSALNNYLKGPQQIGLPKTRETLAAKWFAVRHLALA